MPSAPPSAILIVDAEPAQRQALAQVLRGAGYRTVETDTAGEALQAAAAQKPALIVLNLRRPDMSILEAAQQLKHNPHLASVPILHISAAALEEELRQRALQHAEACLVQPVSRDVLLTAVDLLTRMGRTEESLRHTAQRLSSHLANVPVAVTEWDHQFRARYWSPQAEKMFGYSAAEVLGKAPWEFDLVVEGDVPKVEKVHADMRDGRASSTISFNRNRHKDGSLLHCEWYNSSLHGPGGETSILAITLDVTTRVHYEEEISNLNRELQRRVGELEALLQVMPVGIAIAEDAECRRIRGNLALGRMLGVPITANVSMSAPDSERPHVRLLREGREVPPEELPQQVVGRTGHEVHGVELEVERADGSRGVILGNTVPLFDEEGRTRGSLAAWTDITERRRMEEELRRREQTLSMAFRAAGMWSWDVDLRNSVVTWSEEAREYRAPGYPVLSGTFSQWLAHVHPDDRERVRQEFEKAVRGDREYEVEFRYERDLGDNIWIYARGVLLRDAAGQPERMIGVAMNNTERRRTEEALRASEKMAATGKLAAALAHEINNPLAAITNLVYLINHDPGLSTVSRDYLGMAAGELDRVAHITRSMLSFYRQPAAPTGMIVSRLVEGVVNLHRPQLQASGVTLEYRVHGERPAVGHPAEVQQVVSNLLLNAMESMPKGGRVVVEVRDSQSWSGERQAGTRVLIADNGPGIPLEHRRRLFEPFFSTKQGKGTGLGLWVCHNLAERNGGVLRFRTSTVSARQGTCFSLFLPDSAHRERRKAAAKE